MKKLLLFLISIFLCSGGILNAQAYSDSVGFGLISSKGDLSIPEISFVYDHGSPLPIFQNFVLKKGDGSTKTVDVDVKITVEANKIDTDTKEIIDSVMYLAWRRDGEISTSGWALDSEPGVLNGDFRQFNSDEVLTLVFDSVNNTPPNELYPPVQMGVTTICAWSSRESLSEVYLNGKMVGIWIPSEDREAITRPILTDVITQQPVKIIIEEGDTLQLWGTNNPTTYYRLIAFGMLMEATVATASISLEAEGGNAQITELNGSLNISGTVLPAEASDKRIIWSVDDKGTGATINTGGVLQALPRASGNGTVTVAGTLAANGSISSTIDVLISGQIDVLADSVKVMSSMGIDTINVNGDSLQMIAQIFPDYAANKEIDWSLEAYGTGATISADGLLKANPTENGNGIVTVKATTKDGSGKFGILDVAIVNQGAALVESIDISFDGDFPEIIVDKGTLQLYADVLPGNASNKSVTWSVQDDGTGASIDQTGLLSASGLDSGNGTVKVFATAQDGSGVADSLDVLIMGQVTSVDNIKALQAVSLYPNPINEGQTLFVKVSDDAVSIESISVYLYTGQRLATYTGFAGRTSQFEIPLSGDTGIYLVKVNTNEGSVIQKVVKNK